MTSTSVENNFKYFLRTQEILMADMERIANDTAPNTGCTAADEAEYDRMMQQLSAAVSIMDDAAARARIVLSSKI